MSEKRFEVVQDPRVQTEYFIYDNEDKISENITDYPFDDQDVCSRIVMLLNEQQSKITELEKNFEDLVNWSTEISKRNVLLDEKIGRLQQENKELKNKLNKHL